MAKKKRRGRPPGSKNKAKKKTKRKAKAKRAAPKRAAATKKKKRGRPPGTKNKTKRTVKAKAGKPRGRPRKVSGDAGAAALERAANAAHVVDGNAFLPALADGLGRFIGTLSHIAVSLDKISVAQGVLSGITVGGLGGPGAQTTSMPAADAPRRGRPPKAASTLRAAEPPGPIGHAAPQDPPSAAEAPTSPEPASEATV